MHKGFLKAAAILGAFSVVAGAFAAHSLKERLNENVLNIFETAVRYQFYHVFALLAAGVLYKEFTNKFIRLSGMLFIAGIVLFSGSLYALTYIIDNGITGFNWIGAITPVGGLSFIIGWIFLLVGCFRRPVN